MPDSTRILLIEACDFERYPTGGQLATVIQLIRVCPDRFALVGMETRGGPVGSWTTREVAGRVLPFFAVGRWTPSAQRPIVPGRLSWFAMLRRYRRAICSRGDRSAFIQGPETLIAVRGWGLDDICYLFPGVKNPLSNTRYSWARPFAGMFDEAFLRALRHVNVILAAADRKSIEERAAGSNGGLMQARVIQFPTSVDTEVFRPVPRDEAGARIALGPERPVLVSCGRIARAKGWSLLLDAFTIVHRNCESARLIFVGDGEDRGALEARARQLGLAHAVRVTGFEPPARVSLYLNAADVFVVGSEGEGWSVAMLEALACGKPLVSTRVSGAEELIRPGQNGFIVGERDAAQFAAAVHSALRLPFAAIVSRNMVEPYALRNLRSRLAAVWPALA